MTVTKLRMPKTGNPFIDAFSEVCIYFPLLPVIIIFLKKAYQQESLNFLMILSLLYFVKGLLLLIPGLPPSGLHMMEKLFSLLELLILILIFRIQFTGKLRYTVTLFQVAFLSSFITFNLLTGLHQPAGPVQGAADGILLLMAVYSLSELIIREEAHIFKVPLFWIAGGTIFYFSISLLVQGLGGYGNLTGKAAPADTQLLLDVADAARFLLYSLSGILFDRHPPSRA